MKLPGNSHIIGFNIGSNQVKENILIPKAHRGSAISVSYVSEKESNNFHLLNFNFSYSRLKTKLETDKVTWIRSALFIALSAAVISCLKDEPFKLPYSGFQPVEKDDGWEISTLSTENIDSVKLDRAFRYIYREDEYYLVRSMIIIRNGKIVAEAYPHDPGGINQIQNIKSATKSFTGILCCIALQTGLLDSVNQKLSDIYPECFINHPDKKDITLDNALTMRTGCSGQDENSGYELFFTDNSIEYALLSPWLYMRGISFYYTDANPQLVSYAIQKRYGKPMSEFAREYLFEPLGISDWYWQAAKDGVTFGSSNLSLKPRDMAKLGQMLLQHGKWQAKQVLDSSWVHEATRPHYTSPGWAYGYYFWIYTAENLYFAAGHGGQIIMVVPEKTWLQSLQHGPMSRIMKDGRITLSITSINWLLKAVIE